MSQRLAPHEREDGGERLLVGVDVREDQVLHRSLVLRARRPSQGGAPRSARASFRRGVAASCPPPGRPGGRRAPARRTVRAIVSRFAASGRLPSGGDAARAARRQVAAQPDRERARAGAPRGSRAARRRRRRRRPRGGRGARAARPPRAPRSRKAASPCVAEDLGHASGRARSSIQRSRSTERPAQRARPARGPRVVLPAPMKPTSTMRAAGGRVSHGRAPALEHVVELGEGDGRALRALDLASRPRRAEGGDRQRHGDAVVAVRRAPRRRAAAGRRRSRARRAAPRPRRPCRRSPSRGPRCGRSP